MSLFDPPRPGDDHWDERNWRDAEERRRERERQHAPAPDLIKEKKVRWFIETTTVAARRRRTARLQSADPVLLMVVQVPNDITIGEVVQAVGRQAANHGVTLMLWTERPRRRQRRAMKLLFGRKLGKRLTG